MSIWKSRPPTGPEKWTPHLHVIPCNDKKMCRAIRTHNCGSRKWLTIWNYPPLPADGEAYWLLLPSLVSLLSDSIVQPENTYSFKVTGQVWENQKRVSINTNHSYTTAHLPKLVSTDLTIKSNIVLTNPRGKDGVPGCMM